MGISISILNLVLEILLHGVIKEVTLFLGSSSRTNFILCNLKFNVVQKQHNVLQLTRVKRCPLFTTFSFYMVLTELKEVEECILKRHKKPKTI